MEVTSRGRRKRRRRIEKKEGVHLSEEIFSLNEVDWAKKKMGDLLPQMLFLQWRIGINP